MQEFAAYIDASVFSGNVSWTEQVICLFVVNVQRVKVSRLYYI